MGEDEKKGKHTFDEADEGVVKPQKLGCQNQGRRGEGGGGKGWERERGDIRTLAITNNQVAYGIHHNFPEDRQGIPMVDPTIKKH